MLNGTVEVRSVDDLPRVFRELSFLQRILAEAAAAEDYDAMLHLIIDETTEVTGVAVCSLYLLESDDLVGSDEARLVLQATNGLNARAIGSLRLAVGEGVTGWVAEHRKPLAIVDVRLDPRFKFIDGVDDERLTSMLSVPIIFRERTIGVLNIQTAEPRTFTQQEVDFLQTLANQLAGIIELRRLNQQTGQQLETLRALFRVSTLLNSTLQLDALLQRFLQEVDTLFPNTLLSLLLLDEEREWLQIEAASGFRERNLSERVCRLGEGVSGRVAATGVPAIVEDLSAAADFSLPQLVDQEGVRALLSVPLPTSDGIWGTLNIYRRERRRFSQVEVEIAQALANQAALSIRNAQRYESERIAAAQLNEANQRLLRAFETHGRFTQLVLADQGVDPIARTLANLLQARVLVEGRYFDILAAAAPDGTWNDWSPLTLSEHAQARPDVREQLNRAVATKRPVRLGPFPDDGLTSPRTVLAIAAGKHHFGYLSVIHEEPLERTEAFVAVEQATTVLALEFMKQKAAFEVEQRLKGDFIELLISDDAGQDFGRIQAQASYLGLNLRQSHLLMLADVGPPPRPIEPARPAPDLRRLQEVAQSEIRAAGGGLVALKQDAVVILCPISEPGRKASREALERLHRAMERMLRDHPVRLAIGAVCVEPRQYRASYRQARTALDSMRQLGRSGLMSADELGPYQLLLSIPDDGLLDEFARRELGPLLDYDERHRTELTLTLEALLRCNGNLKRTASELFIHVNTLAYRLQRIHEIMDIDLDDAQRRTSLYLALLILRMAREPASPAIAHRARPGSSA